MDENGTEEKQRKVIYVPYEINSKKIIVTYVLIALNILMYAVMIAVGKTNGWSNGEQLWMFGAKVNYCIAEGEYWRLFTCMFLHANVLHLLTNCYALFAYGKITEKLFGRWRFIAIYILAGLTSSCLSYMLSNAASVGASGAIFGLFGALLYFGQKRRETFKKIFGWHFLTVLALNLFIGFIIPEIDMFGHIGGLIGGYVATAAIGFMGEKVNWTRTLIMGAVYIAIICGCLFIKIV